MKFSIPVRTIWPGALALLGLLAGDIGAGELRLIERRADARQKTEAEVDLPPNCIVTGIGARAHVDNLTTLHVQYRPLLPDGTLGPPGEKHLGNEPDHGCEAKILLPEGWVAVGFGARGAPEWDVATLRVWGRRWNPRGGELEVRAWSAGREPEAGLERSILLEEPDRVLVGVGLRFHQNDIQGIYARSARVVSVPAGDRSMRSVRIPEPSDSRPADSTPVLRLLPPELGPVSLAALDADRMQAELLALWRRGAREIHVDAGGLAGTAAEPAREVCAALMADPFQSADGILREIVKGRVGEDRVDVAVRALARVPLIARLVFSAAGQRFLGKGGIPRPDELPAIAAASASLRNLSGEKESARWLLVQSQREISSLREGGDSTWLSRVALELEDLALAADVWGSLSSAEILSRMYLIDGSPGTREESRMAIEKARAAGRKPAFGDSRPLEEAILARLATPAEKTRLGGTLAGIEILARAGERPRVERAAAELAALLEDSEQNELRSHLRRHWDTIGRLASLIDVFEMDTASVRVLWGGDGRWRISKQGGLWAWVTAPVGPCVYFDVVGTPGRALLRFEYFDDGKGRIHIHYNAIDPETGNRSDYFPAPTVEMGGTGAWQEAEVVLERCVFLGRQNRSADFRLIPDRRGVGIRGVRIEPK